ncbi:hypothetical protein SAMN05216593_12535 [Pseudomonas asturiensis]|uniref:Uncharacterized protein n=1 Tax=Pseudomonas asturiensis TaxID=1190415 RepID=A0A1M7QFY0_9PSED|nr:hypothetical protein SAMN05216593_12535 [Pseudomonas asturiensis]
MFTTKIRKKEKASDSIVLARCPCALIWAIASRSALDRSGGFGRHPGPGAADVAGVHSGEHHLFLRTTATSRKRFKSNNGLPYSVIADTELTLLPTWRCPIRIQPKVRPANALRSKRLGQQNSGSWVKPVSAATDLCPHLFKGQDLTTRTRQESGSGKVSDGLDALGHSTLVMVCFMLFGP